MGTCGKVLSVPVPVYSVNIELAHQESDLSARRRRSRRLFAEAVAGANGDRNIGRKRGLAPDPTGRAAPDGPPTSLR